MNCVDQIVDGCHAVFFRDIGDMGITGCCFGTGMAKKDLYVTKAQTSLKEICCKIVAQGMYGGFF